MNKSTRQDIAKARLTQDTRVLVMAQDINGNTRILNPESVSLQKAGKLIEQLDADLQNRTDNELDNPPDDQVFVTELDEVLLLDMVAGDLWHVTEASARLDLLIGGLELTQEQDEYLYVDLGAWILRLSTDENGQWYMEAMHPMYGQPWGKRETINEGRKTYPLYLVLTAQAVVQGHVDAMAELE